MKRQLSLIILTMGLAACATQQGASTPPKNYRPAINVSNNSTPVQRRHLVTSPAKFIAAQKKIKNVYWKGNKRLVGVAAVRAANKKATRQPISSNYLNAIMTYDFVPGALYKIYCAPLNVTDVELKPGERIISVAAGDTLRWQVSKTYSGAGIARVEHLVVKPTDVNLKDSLVVTTNQHTYHLMFYSTKNTYMASVRWRYPGEDNLVQNYGSSSANPTILSDFSGVNVGQLDFNYYADVIHGSKPDWMPTMIFNNGHKTYIQFPGNMQEAPTLFIGDDFAGDKMINYRVNGNYYVVDRVIRNAQLRSGQDNPVVVQIHYSEDARNG